MTLLIVSKKPGKNPNRPRFSQGTPWGGGKGPVESWASEKEDAVSLGCDEGCMADRESQMSSSTIGSGGVEWGFILWASGVLDFWIAGVWGAVSAGWAISLN